MEQLEFHVYVKKINDDLIPDLLLRLNSFDIECSFLKKFSFAEHTGFLPFKFYFKDKTNSFLKDNMLVSGFDLSLNHFNFHNEPSMDLSDPGIRNILETCSQVLIFKWDNVDIFELRFAFLTSAIITELSDGIFHYPQKNIWNTKDNIVQLAWNEVQNYENSIPLKQLDFFGKGIYDKDKGEIPEYTRIINMKERYFSFDYSF